MITPELEEKIREMRKTDEYCMMSVSEIFRRLVQLGLEQIEQLSPDPQT
jgi:Arc/MetJ-type ribon-helix-helix transcriptional regulator